MGMREKLIELLCKAHGMATDASLFEDASYAQQLEAEADHLIANGVTTPVRCKDCRHWEECESSLVGKVMCCTGQGFARIQKLPEDFCSYGERRADA